MHESSENPFSYNKLIDLPRRGIEYNNYMCASFGVTPNFISFSGMAGKSNTYSKEGRIFKKHGLKFHISLPETDREKYNVGWDIVAKILMQHNVLLFKVVKPGIKMSDEPDQRGKDITIYTDENPEKSIHDWTNVLTQITVELTASKVPPGYRPPGTSEKKEACINGSNYISYRYYDEQKKRSDWPKDDPCKKILVQVDNQLAIPRWENQVQKTTTSSSNASIYHQK